MKVGKMQAKDRLLIELVNKKDISFKIPYYQRKYKWKFEKEIKTLLVDIKEFIKSSREDYFLGTIVLKDNEKINFEKILVDGQQRITTLFLILSALREITFNKEIVHNQEIAFVQEKTTLFQKIIMILESDEAKHKLIRIVDQQIIQSIMKNKLETLTKEDKNSNYFKIYEKLKNYFQNEDIKNIENFVIKGIFKLKVAIIKLNKDEDEFLVFESINSKGQSLDSADLIKNYIMMNATEDQSNLLENTILKKINDKDSIDFYRQWLAILTGKLLSKTDKSIYYEFKLLFKKEDITQDFFKNMYHHILVWEYIHKHKFPNLSLPFIVGSLLNFYGIFHTFIYKNSIVVMNDKLNIENQFIINQVSIRIASMSIRRLLQGSGRVESNRSYAKAANTLFSTNSTYEDFITKVVDVFKKSSKKDKIPSDDEIKLIISNIDVYSNQSLLKWVFIAIEQIDLKEEINIEKIIVKQIISEKSLIQSKNTDEIKQKLNTLGNLWIAIKSSSKNNIFINESHLHMNKFINESKKWDIKEINKREKNLVEKILRVWKI